TLRKTLAEGEVLLSGTPYYIRQMKENRSDGATGQLVEKFQAIERAFLGNHLSWQNLWLTPKHGNSRALRRTSHVFFFQQQSAAGFQRNRSNLCLDRHGNGFRTNDRNVETHVLIWFGDLDHDSATPTKRTASADCLIGSIKSFNREDGPIFNDYGLPNIQRGNFLRDTPAEVDVRLFPAR